MTMNRRSRFLLIAMSTAFAICVLGLVVGLVDYLSQVYIHRTLENVMSNSITYNTALGGIGILGIILFFAFLLSLMSKNHSEKSR
jgi:hypothetical protein